MDKVIIAYNKKQFLGDCVHNPFDSKEELDNIINDAIEISKKEFLENVEIDIGDDDTMRRMIKEYPNDFEFFKNNDIYFLRHSAIEYFYG